LAVLRFGLRFFLTFNFNQNKKYFLLPVHTAQSFKEQNADF
jgi:hypothetical protein